jgi:hypothetical protein
MSWIEVIRPERFDGNEIYVICIALIIVGVLYFLEKKYKCLYASELLFIWAFDHMLSVTGDYLLALPPWDLYDTFDEADVDLVDILVHTIDYPGLVIIFVCIYALTKARGIRKVAIVLSGAFTGAVVEFIGVMYLHTFLYKRWNTFYSFLFYILVFSINLYIYDKVHQYVTEKRQKHLNQKQ